MSLLSVTDLINILFVDVPDAPSGDDDGVAETTEQQGGAGATIVLPSAGQQLSALAGSELSACETVEQQFRLLKRSYFGLIRHVHPDKGGDAPTFRKVQNAFQHLRGVYDAAPKIGSFTDPSVLIREFESNEDADDDDDEGDTNANPNVQPWEFYAAAATVDDPLYRVELAKSDRSRCSQASASARRCTQESVDKVDRKTGRTKTTLVNPKIAQGEIRCGHYDDKAGSYTRWNHLECWRIPSKVWLGLPDANLGPQGATEEQKVKAAAAARASDAGSSLASASSNDGNDDASSSDDEDEDEDDDNNDAVLSTTKYQQYASALLAMNEVYICGFSELPKKERKEFVLHVMNRCNWARYTKPKKKKAKKDAEAIAAGVAVPGLGVVDDSGEDEDGAKKPAAAVAAAASAAGGGDMLVASTRPGVPSTTALAVAKSAFVPPALPPLGKGVAGSLDGERFVLTGIFPELGGGSGLGLGKKQAEDIITTFGGKVTGSISGKTNYLLVGKEPGMSKVKKANANSVQRLNLEDLKNLCEGGSSDDIQHLQITSFSSGYGGTNGLAIKASASELASVAAAQQPTQPMITNGDDEDGAKKPAAKKSKGGKAEAKKPAAKKGTKTKKQLKAEAKAAAAKKAADDKTERKSKLAKATEIQETAVEDLDWETLLEAGDLDNEKMPFLKKILKHLKLKVSGKKAELLARLRDHAGLDDSMDEDDDANEGEDSDDEEMDVDYEDAKPSASSSSSEEGTFDDENEEVEDMRYYDDEEGDEDPPSQIHNEKLRADFSAEAVDDEAVV